MGKFSELYSFCQELKPKVSRKHITKKTVELTGTKVKAVIAGLDTKICRGFFISASNKEARLVQMLGTNVIVLARELNYCWERFVFTKELMHLFDEGAELTSTPESFAKLLAEFGQPGLERSGPLSAELKAFWMALACLCPEKHRLHYQEELKKGHMDSYAIALQLKIPEYYVPSLFIPHYKDVIAQLLKN